MRKLYAFVLKLLPTKSLIMWCTVLFLLPLATAYYIDSCPQACSCDTETANCKGLDLTELPDEIDPSINYLDLSWNLLQRVPEDIKTFTELRYLNLSYNKISTLLSTDFQNLNKLETLDLSGNKLRDWKDIHSTSFRPTINLKWLDLSRNPLRSINSQSNHLNIKSLIILKLTNCSMKTISVPVFNRLTNLRELHLAANPLVTINETFQLNDLRLIDLSRCLLNYIDENVFTSLVNLEVLNINQNIHLKRFLCHSESLSQLDLSGCVLEKVPNGRLRNLKRLDISFNYIKNIPANSFLNYNSLEILNLSTNAITWLHQRAFENLKDLQNIDLSFNKLSTISEQLFYNNSALVTLNVSHNYIRLLDTISSDSLKTLIINNCEIHEMKKYSLAMMPRLATLMMSRNYIRSLPDGLIGDNLIVLDISSCGLKTINNRTFEKMFFLRQINLANNALTRIDPSYFPRAYNVIIHDNAWRCDCPELKHMFEFTMAYSVNRIDDLKCDSPEQYAGKTWEEVCTDHWYPVRVPRETMWYYSVGLIVFMLLALFAVIILRKVKDIKEERIRTEQEARRAEEQEILRQMQERARDLQEEEDRNAPDPRELQRPPSYTEALLLPPLDASHPSLAGSLHSFGSRPSLRGSNPELSKKRRKRLRRKSEEQRRASRMTLDSDSSEENGQQRRRAPQAPPLESDF